MTRLPFSSEIDRGCSSFKTGMPYLLAASRPACEERVAAGDNGRRELL